MISFLQAWQPNPSTSSLWHLVGWTMCYFLVTGTAVALLGGILRLVCSPASPSLRYMASLTTLFTLALLPLGNAAWLVATLPAETVKLPPPSTPPTNLDLNQTPLPIPLQLERAPKKPTPSTNSTTPQNLETDINQPNPTLAFSPSSIPFKTILTYLPWLWIVGAPVTFLLLATGLVGSVRLRHQCQPLTTGIVTETCLRLQNSLQVTRQVSVAVCDRIAQPVLVGILRPLILLPPAALTGWSPAELEMVLLHELAHVRRWDNLVNLCQRLIESLLFFHPAVWLVSRQVRRDREQCCDALVVAHTSQPQAYAELLINIASTGNTRSATLATASALADHPLAGRIRRILNIKEEPMLVTRGTLGGFTLVVATIIALTLWQPNNHSVAEEALTSNKRDDQYSDIEKVELKIGDRASVEEFSLIFDSVVDDLKFIRVNGNSAKISIAQNGLPKLAPYSESPSIAMNSDLARMILYKLLFKKTKDNPVKSIEYVVPSDLHLGTRKTVGDIAKSMKSDSDGPGIDLDLAILDDGKAVRFTAPLAAHWWFKNVLQANLYSYQVALKKSEKDTHAKETASNKDPKTFNLEIGFPVKIKTGDPERIVEELVADGFQATLDENSIRDGIARKMIVEIPPGTHPRVVFEEDQTGYHCRIIALEKITISYEIGDVQQLPLLQWAQVTDEADVQWGEEIGSKLIISTTKPQHDKIAELLERSRSKNDSATNNNHDHQTGPKVWVPSSNKAEVFARSFDRSQYLPKTIAPGDQLMIKVDHAFPDYPIDGVFQVEPAGTVALGPTYGRAFIAGTTLPEAEKKLLEYLKQTLADPLVQVTWHSIAKQAPAGKHTPEAFRTSAFRQQELLLEIEYAKKVLSNLTQGYKRLLQMRHKGIVSEKEVGDYQIQLDRAELDVNKLKLQLDTLSKQESAKTSNVPILYDGRTFEEWRTLWRTELKTELRTDCINALAAFARAGRAEEAVNTILDVAAEYDFSFFESSNKPKGALKRSVLEHLTNLPLNQWLPEILKRYETDPEKWFWLASQLIGEMPYKNTTARQALLDIANAENKLSPIAAIELVQVDPTLQHPETPQLARRLLKSDDLNHIIKLLGFFQYRYLDRLPEQFNLLFHPDKKIRTIARSYLQTIQSPEAIPSQTLVIDKLIETLNDPQQAEKHLSAIRALEALKTDYQSDQITSLLIRFARERDQKLLGPTLVAISKLLAKRNISITTQGIVANIMNPDEQLKAGNLSEERRELLKDKEQINQLIQEELDYLNSLDGPLGSRRR